MNCIRQLLAGMSAFLPLLACAAETGPKLFPEAKDLPPGLKTPAGTVVTFAGDGTPLIDGKPRYLIGVKICSGSPDKDLLPRPGYPAFMKWLYEKPMCLETAHRLGFDFISVNGTTPGWVNHLFPDEKQKMWQGYECLFRTGLPLHLDLGGFAPWEVGCLKAPRYRRRLPEEAFNDFESGHGNHWMPYSIFSSEGKKLYLDRWEFGIREAIANGANLMRVEIFNEPSYTDFSSVNRAEFAKYLKRKYGTVEAMNKNWKNASYASFEAASKFRNPSENRGLSVDWSKFLEEGFTELCREGIARIQKIKPGLHVCFQSRGTSYFRYLPDTHHNLYAIQNLMHEVSTGTAGGTSFAGALEPSPTGVIDTPSAPWVGEGMLQIAFCRAVADGKSIHDDETYFRGENQANGFYQEMMRGVNQITMFEFSKRAWDWKNEKEGRANAARRSWMILNPYALDYREFAFPMKVKKNILAVSDLFAWRDRKAKKEIAFLFSYPTERYSAATGNLSSAYAHNAFSALSFISYEPDLVFEEQLPAGRQDRYRVIVAAGVKNTFDKTPGYLEKWVKNGGILIGLLDPMAENEYGFPHSIRLFPKRCKAKDEPLAWNGPRLGAIPGKLSGYQYLSVEDSPGWEKLGNNACRRKLGKGYLYYIGTRYADYSLASVLGGILASHSVMPVCTILNAETPEELAPNIEIASANRSGFAGLMMLNQDLYPKLVLVKSPAFKPGSLVLESFKGEFLTVRKDGSVLVDLAPVEAKCLIAGSTSLLAKRMPSAVKRTEKEIRKRFAELPRPVRKAGFRYDVSTSAMKVLDLRKQVNREFRDNSASDGKGGWTDQGSNNSLQEVPFGMQNFLGIPCDIIRWDMNNDKTCIVLDSTKLKPGFGVRDSGEIEVHEKAKALYFFHASAWGNADSGKEVMYYLIRYRSGKTLRVPVREGKEIAGWFRAKGWKKTLPDLHLAWSNSSNHGFFCWRWVNPAPEDEIVSLSVHSLSGEAIGIVIAITAERDLYAGMKTYPQTIRSAIGFNDKVPAVLKDGIVKVSVKADARPFGGFRIRMKQPFLKGITVLGGCVPLLAFDVKRGSGAMGMPDNGKAPLTIRVKGGSYLHKGFVPAYGNFKTVVYVFDQLLKDRTKWNTLDELWFQYRGVPTYGAEIGNIRIIMEETKK